ncbi:Uncharacterised protein [Klebsiella pneumoniae]|uniref:Uncharacterized protein n=1 Tax=Klebsiella pneumoniae TaxID=573 RepID=A0A377ZD95_KLEPN|nr:Uncharacterised protein [Klebsiella pneumoniae]
MKSYLYAKNRLMLIILSWLSADEALPSRHDFQQTETILSTLHIPYVLKPDLDQLRATLQQLLATPRPQACEGRRFSQRPVGAVYPVNRIYRRRALSALPHL